MSGKSEDTAGTRILNSMEPTPEAKAILDKQPSRENIRRYDGSKIFLIALGFSPVLVSAIFGYVLLQFGLHSFGAIAMAIVFVAGPLLLAALLVSWARQF